MYTCKKSVYSKNKESDRSVQINHVVNSKRNAQDSGFYLINVNESSCISPLESKPVCLSYPLLLIGKTVCVSSFIMYTKRTEDS